MRIDRTSKKYQLIRTKILLFIKTNKNTVTFN